MLIACLPRLCRAECLVAIAPAGIEGHRKAELWKQGVSAWHKEEEIATQGRNECESSKGWMMWLMSNHMNVWLFRPPLLLPSRLFFPSPPSLLFFHLTDRFPTVWLILIITEQPFRKLTDSMKYRLKQCAIFLWSAVDQPLQPHNDKACGLVQCTNWWTRYVL